MRTRSGNGPPWSRTLRYRRPTTSFIAAKSSRKRGDGPELSPFVEKGAGPFCGCFCDGGADCATAPRTRNLRYSDFFMRPSSQTTIDATVSLPWFVEMSKHSMRRGSDGSDSTSRRVSTIDRKSTRLNSSHSQISYAVFCLKKKKKKH